MAWWLDFSGLPVIRSPSLVRRCVFADTLRPFT